MILGVFAVQTLTKEKTRSRCKNGIFLRAEFFLELQYYLTVLFLAVLFFALPLPAGLSGSGAMAAAKSGKKTTPSVNKREDTTKEETAAGMTTPSEGATAMPLDAWVQCTTDADCVITELPCVLVAANKVSLVAYQAWAKREMKDCVRDPKLTKANLHTSCQNSTCSFKPLPGKAK